MTLKYLIDDAGVFLGTSMRVSVGERWVAEGWLGPVFGPMYVGGTLDGETGEVVGGEWVSSSVPLAEVLSTEVDAERDRRINAGFEFQGVWYQSRLPSVEKSGDWEVFSGKSLEALLAILAGAQPGNLRWSDPSEDFSWIAADNSRVLMDAQTVIELGKAASAHRSSHTFAGSDLKAMQPIPADYTDDKWWP